MVNVEEMGDNLDVQMVEVFALLKYLSKSASILTRSPEILRTVASNWLVKPTSISSFLNRYCHDHTCSGRNLQIKEVCAANSA